MDNNFFGNLFSSVFLEEFFSFLWVDLVFNNDPSFPLPPVCYFLYLHYCKCFLIQLDLFNVKCTVVIFVVLV